MRDDRLKRERQAKIDKMYYKAHFGPEETEERVVQKIQRQQMQRRELQRELD
jgi:hypothetical protein